MIPEVIYDDYIWRLESLDSSYPIILKLPKDLLWNNEYTEEKNVIITEYSLEGSFLVQGGIKKIGRSIVLAGTDDMAWLTREQCQTLLEMKNIYGLEMRLSFAHRDDPSNRFISFIVIFDQTDISVDLAPIKQFDQFEPTAYCIVNELRFFEIRTEE